MKKTMRDLIDSKKKFIGAFMLLPSPDLIEMFSYAGIDFVIIDNEHSTIDQKTTLDMVRAAELSGAAAMVRVSDVDEMEIKKALDMGASALMVPGVHCYEDALKVVEYAKFKPLGNRGASPGVRANRYGMDDHNAYYEKQNKETVIFVAMEGPEVIKDLDKIVKIEGIDILGVGPIDMSVALGSSGHMTPEVKQAIADVKKAANMNGKLYATFYEYIEDIIEPEEDADFYMIAGDAFCLHKWLGEMSKKIKTICER